MGSGSRTCDGSKAHDWTACRNHPRKPLTKTTKTLEYRHPFYRKPYKKTWNGPVILRKEQIVEVPKMEYVDLVREIPRWELNSAP